MSVPTSPSSKNDTVASPSKKTTNSKMNKTQFAKGMNFKVSPNIQQRKNLEMSSANITHD
jgi:hypothetical protein